MIITFKGELVKLLGDNLNVGDYAPKIRLADNNLNDKIVGGKMDRVQIINVMPSLDAPICTKQAKKFNKKSSQIQEADASVITMDLPFASDRFCAVEKVRINVLSDFRHKEFAKKYGVLIGNTFLEGLTARAIFIVDKNGQIAYKEIVKEITNESDYDKAISFAKSLI